LSPFAIEAKGLDDFLVDQYHLDPVVMNMHVAMITADWAARRPDSTPGDVYEHLEVAGIIQLTALLREVTIICAPTRIAAASTVTLASGSALPISTRVRASLT
jgi:hypothetical protein